MPTKFRRFLERSKDAAKRAKQAERKRGSVKPPKPPTKARNWLSALTNDHGYWNTRFSSRTRNNKTTGVFWIPKKDKKARTTQMTKIEIPINEAFGMKGAKPVMAFFNTKNQQQLVVVTRAENAKIVNGQTVVDVAFRAHSVPLNLKNQRVGLNNMFLLAEYQYFPEHGIVAGGDFRWTPENVEHRLVMTIDAEMARPDLGHKPGSGETRPPEFIAKKGFGLAVNHLRDLDHAKQGVRKIFGRIDQNSASKRFAEKRGFRELTQEERALLARINPKVLVETAGTHTMVRDFKG